MLSAQEIEDYIHGPSPRREKNQYTVNEAKQIGDALGIRWDAFAVEQFALGMNVELGHLRRGPVSEVARDEAILTGKTALAHLTDFPDYYTRHLGTADGAERTERLPAAEGQ